MAKLNEFYKCATCGNIVGVVHAGGGELVCCGKPMALLVANTVDASKEKHVPVVEKTEKGFIVKIGLVPHPMEKEHYIEWVSVYFDDGKVGRKYLKPGDQPEAEFCMAKMPAKVLIYCNLHGLWSN